jgi:hypothetical protein
MGRLFQNANCGTIENNLILHKGIAKGVRMIQNDGITPCAALVVDGK